MVKVSVPPWLKTVAVKCVLPTALLAAAISRPCFLSIGYVILALISASLPKIHKNNPLPKTIGIFVTITFIFTVVVGLVVTAYQISEVVVHKNESTYICNRSDTTLFRSIGLLRYHRSANFESYASFLPEIIATLTSFFVLVITLFFSHQNERAEGNGDAVVPIRNVGNDRQTRLISKKQELMWKAVKNSLRRLTNFLIFLLTAFAGIVEPSVSNIIYFLAFLFISSWWATYTPLRHRFYNKIKQALVLYSGVHFCALYSYQIPIVHDTWLPPKTLIPRWFGLNVLIDVSCPNWWKYRFVAADYDEKNNWLNLPHQVNPIVILIFYYFTIAQYKFTRNGSRQYIDDNDFGSSVHEERFTSSGTVESHLDDDDDDDDEDNGGSDKNLIPMAESGAPIPTSSSTSRGRERGNTLLLSESGDQNREDESVVRNEGVDNNSIPMRKMTSQVVDRNKLSHIFNVPGEQESATSKGMIAMITFAIYHAYSIALTAMMTWALLYHSIFGLILLIVTCILWICNDTRLKSFIMSPILLAYIEFLLLLQYMLSMDIQKEIGYPKWVQFFGIQWNSDPLHATIILCVQTILSLPVFLLLRLARREKYYNSLTDFERQRRINSYGTFGASKRGVGGVAVAKDPKSRKFAAFIEYFSHKISVYFIFLVFIVLLIVATYFKPTFYTIGFFVIWSLALIYLKISFRLFRGVAYAFWVSLTIYTSIVIIALYIYQFEGVSLWLQQTTGLTKQWFDAIGLVDYSAIGESGALFLRLFAPIALFVVTMLQLKFFHDSWSRATMPRRADNEPQRSNEAAENGRGDRLAQKVHKFVNETIELLWRFFEVHITNIVFIIIAVFIANNIYALYIPLVVLLSLTIVLPSNANGLFSIFMCSYMLIVAILKMIYQLDIIPELAKIDRGVGAENCTYNVSMAAWFGLIKEQESTPMYMLGGVLISIVALAIQSIVIYRQRHLRLSRGLPELERSNVFPDFHYSQYDRSFANAFKFLIDYGFYKFGLEICICMMGLDAWLRMDALAVIQCFWILVFAPNQRQFNRKIWPIYVIYMSLLYPIQFILYVGLPPDSCIKYPWTSIFPSMSSESNHNLAVMLGLSVYNEKWPPSYLIVDFFLLLLSSCQLAVFRREAEDNDSIYSDGVFIIKKGNPKYDFIDIKKSPVDYVKTIIFHYGHWITLITTLAAGIAGTSLFSLGYILLTLWLLWQGNNLYIMNARVRSFEKTLKRWNLILGYTLFTITMKVILQIFGCVFLNLLNRPNDSWQRVLCIFRQLFSITCVNRLALPLPDTQDFEKICAADSRESAIGYDIIALAFLVFQIRAFHSWYFQHCMVEYRCEVILANSKVSGISRGAVLKNQLIEKEMKEQNDQQKEKFNEIRRRTEAIRERYHKQIEKGVKISDPKTYANDDCLPWNEDDPFPQYDLRVSSNSPTAKRSGDYYMFNYDPENDLLVEPVDSFVPEVDPKATEYNRLDPGQIMYAATSHDLNLAKTLEQVKRGDQIKNAEDRALTAVSTAEKPKPVKRLTGGVDNEDVVRKGSKQDDEKPTDDDEAQHQQKKHQNDEEEKPNSSAEGKESKIESTWKFGSKMLSSFLDLCSTTLNKLCREHRYVGYVLSQEKQKLKAGHADSISNTSRKLTEIRSDVDLATLQLVHSENDVEKMETAATTDWQEKSSIMRFLNAFVNCIGAHTDVLCYLSAIMTQGMTGGLLTMPLPLMSLFWGNLSNPRPSKFFWVTMITYTEFVIVVKFICQFSFFPHNTPEYITDQGLNPMSLDKLFGVSKQNRSAFWDINLLFALFFHRYMLRKLGLWKDANLTDTFLKNSTSSRVSTGANPSREDAAQTSEQSIKNIENEPPVEAPTQLSSIEVVQQEAAEEAPPRGPICRFINQLFHPKFRYIRDLYPIMFGIDVICFLIMTIGYSAFGEGGSGNVLNDVKASRIPVTLVVMLVGMTIAIIVDRALYLRKSVTGKLIYQVVMIGFLHIWIFLLLPDMTRRSALTNKVAQAMYVIKSCYLLVSAWQIRNGYPELCIGNLLTHSYGFLNMVAFKVFMNIPFLFELRTAIDWTWTDTSMPLFDFFNMENFYAHIFNIKCARQFEQAYPSPRGVTKGKLVKYMMGFPIILGIVIFIWSPLLLWSLLNQIGTISMPEKVTLTVAIEGYPPLYEIEAQGRNHDNKELRLIRNDELNNLNKALTKRYTSRDSESILRSRMSISFLKGYTWEDILMVHFRPESEVYWPISQDSIDAMIDKLSNQNASVNFEVTLEFQRPYNSNENTALTHSKSWLVAIDQKKNLRDEIIATLNGTGNKPITIENAIPTYIQVPNSGELTLPTPIGTSIVQDSPSGEFNTTGMSKTQIERAWFDTIHLEMLNGTTPNTRIWIANLKHPGKQDDSVWIPNENTTYSHRPYVQVVGFVERAFPSFLAKIFKGGVIAMYLSVVIVVGRGIVRGIFTTSPNSVMFTELPNVDHLMKICLDIYLVREAKDFMLEQDLYAKLIFLFRSPATLIEWTRMSKVKEE